MQVTLVDLVRRYVAAWWKGAFAVGSVGVLFAVGAFTRSPPALAFVAASAAASGSSALPLRGAEGDAGPVPSAVATPLVPVSAASAAPTATASASAPHEGRASPTDPVILNTATAQDLRRLPGVGPKRADAILALRTRLGRFRSVDELTRVKGLGRKTLQRLRPLLRIDPPPE